MDIQLENKFQSYPQGVRAKLLGLRDLIFKIAAEEGIGEVVESLKWGQPSYKSPQGSAVRIDWQAKSPKTISVFFNCQTTLVETFREIFDDQLNFNGNREVVISMEEKMPEAEIRTCISLSLRYHAIKHLPLLGE